MATSGAMDHDLISVKQRDYSRAKFWKELTSYLIEADYPYTIHYEEPMTPPEDLSSTDLENWYLNI
ncbi:MAG: hypothetical protein HZR80_05570 [Candidatus Heimdallarchaeota archaeon]